MTEDWRLTADLDDEGAGAGLLGWLREARLEGELRDRLGDRVAVSRDGDTVFLYVDTRAGAEAAESVIRQLLEEQGLSARITFACWHPIEQRWEDPSIPLPASEAEVEAEEAIRERRERAESWARGAAEWEVRVELPGHDETSELAERLEGEGIPVVRRWRYLLVGAASEADARELAARLRREAPAGSGVEVEAGGEMVWEVIPQNPFAIFGGLGA